MNLNSDGHKIVLWVLVEQTQWGRDVLLLAVDNWYWQSFKSPVVTQENVALLLERRITSGNCLNMQSLVKQWKQKSYRDFK